MARHPYRVACVLALLAAVTVAGRQQPDAHGWPTATPASVGLDPKVLAAFDADVAGGTYGYVDSVLVIRHGKAVLDRAYPHDYGRIYAAEAGQAGPLNAHDPTGPYNYFNPWWHPFYRRAESRRDYRRAVRVSRPSAFSASHARSASCEAACAGR